jgi:hypothetical protein
MKQLTLCCLCLLACGLLGGCATVYPPQQTLKEPVTVYVADYGVHSSLLLPTGEGQFVEYAFGDWGYAAQNHCLPQDAVGALVLSFQSALGRRYHDLRPGETEPRPKERPWSLSRVNCERADVDALLQRLNARYEAALQNQKPVRNPDNGIDFVKDSEHYSMLNNCNHLTARSLEQLGCRVQGLVVSSKFNVAQQPGSSSPSASSRTVDVKPKGDSPVPGWNTASLN